MIRMKKEVYIACNISKGWKYGIFTSVGMRPGMENTIYTCKGYIFYDM